MEKIMILNGSPRAPRSNSARYADLFMKACKKPAEYFSITPSNHLKLCAKMKEYSDVLLVFPLYVDALPVTLLNFLKTLEEHLPEKRPVISVLINCGFLESYQNNSAVDMVKAFCKKTNFPFGSVLKTGSGEAILSTPFKFLAAAKIKQLAKSIASEKYRTFHVTMPLPSRLFIKASEKYWMEYGRKNGITPEEMRTMEIEP